MTTTAIDAAPEIAKFLSRLEELYGTIEEWVKADTPNATIAREVVEITEEEIGTYSAPVLIIQRPGYKRDIKLVAKGCYPIAGIEGKVEIWSTLGKEVLYFMAVDQDIKVKVLITDAHGGRKYPEFSGKDEALGWVWIQNRRMEFNPSLTSDVFFRIMEILSR